MPRLGLDDFAGGLWIPDESATLLEQAGFAVPSNALLTADNLDYLPSGAVRGRRGSSKYNSSALPGPVLTLRRYYARPVPGSQAGLSIGGNNPAVGTRQWFNTAGVTYLFDGSHASVNLVPAQQSHYLVAFRPFVTTNLPAGATVTGISLRVVARAQQPTNLPIQASVRILQDYVPVGTDKSTAAALSGVFETYDFGGVTDLWGTALTVDEINRNFGIGISWVGVGSLNTIEVAWMLVTVNYTAALNNAFVAGATSGGSLIYYRGTGSGFTAISGGTVASPSRRPRVVSWPQKGLLFFFDGVNEVRQYDGATMSVVPTRTFDGLVVGTAPHKGPYAALHKNQLYATDPAELASSVYASDIGDEQTWRGRLHLAVNDDRGGFITGLESFGDALVILKNTAVFRFLGDPEFQGQLTQISANGCVAPDSVAVTPYGVIHVGREGVWLTDGDQTMLLSSPIRSLFVERTTQHVYAGAVGVYYPRRDQYWLHLDPAGSSVGYVLHRVPVTGGEPVLAWSRVPGLPMNCGTVWDGAGDTGQLYLGDRSGFVWLRDVGAVDGAAAYTSELLTAQRLLDRSRVQGRVYRVRPISRSQGTVAAGLRYDQVAADDVALVLGAAGVSPTIQEPRQYVGSKSVFGRFVSFRCQSTEGPAFELHRVDLDVRLRGQRVWR